MFKRRKIGKDMTMIQNAGAIIEEPAFLRKWSGYRNLEYLYGIRNSPDRKYLSNIMRMRELFLNAKESGKMMLLDSHNKDDIDILCDEVYEMENGHMERIR